MKKLLIIAILFVSTVAIAQPALMQQPSEFTIKVSPQELDVISKGLGSQPFNDVVPLMNKLRAQVLEQQPKSVLPVDDKNKADEPKK